MTVNVVRTTFDSAVNFHKQIGELFRYVEDIVDLNLEKVYGHK